jgi:hypothetical protein
MEHFVVHVFWYQMNEFGHFYHDETNQPINELGLIAMDNELIR